MPPKPLDYYRTVFPPAKPRFSHPIGPHGAATGEEILAEDGDVLTTEDGESLLLESA